MALKSALVFGSTGLVGSKLVKQLLQDDRYALIRVINRTSLGYRNEKLEETILPFEKLEAYSALFNVDEVFICLGTTIKKAGSKAQFKCIDLELPHRIAQISREQSVTCLLMISSIGANQTSSNFYLKTKGEAEKAVIDAGPKKTYLLRPSIILGARKEKRSAEIISKWFIKNFEFLFVGSLKKYRGIYAEELANALIFIANSMPSKKIIESEDLIAISRE